MSHHAGPAGRYDTAMTDWLAAQEIRDRADAELVWSQRAAQLHRAELHRQHADAYERALAGAEPADALPPELREDLVRQLVAEGWDTTEIAAITRMTTYMVGRIRRRLDLPTYEPEPAPPPKWSPRALPACPVLAARPLPLPDAARSA